MLDPAFQKTLIFASLLIFIPYCFFPALWSLAGGYSLGWDEAVYATKARSWIEHTPADQFVAYRPIGMPIFGWLFLQFSDSEETLRLFGAIFGAITLIFLFLLFARLTKNVWVALSIVLLVGTSSLFLREAPQFLNDIPSAGLLFGTLWILWRYYETAGASRIIYLAAPLAAAAFYLRYGAILPLGIIGIVTLVLLLQSFAEKPNSKFPPIGVTIALFLILMIPHFIQSSQSYGTLLGILTASSDAAGREYLGEGLVDYAKLLPNALAGPLMGITSFIGVFITFLIPFHKRLYRRHGSLLWLGVIGILTFLFTGLLIHGEPRYVFFPLALLAGVGVSGIYALLKNNKQLQSAFIVTLMVLALFVGVINYQQIRQEVRQKESDEFRNAFVQSLEVIRSHAPQEEECAVWTTDFRPQVSWYTKCNVFGVGDIPAFQKDFREQAAEYRYSVFLGRRENEQIQTQNADQYGVMLEEVHQARNLSSEFGEIVVWRLYDAPQENP